MRSSWITLPPLVALGASAVAARAQGEWVLIDRDLREQRVELTQLREGVVMFSDGQGRARGVPVSELLGILHERPSEDRPSRELPWLTQQMEMFGPDAELPEEAPEDPFVASLWLTNGERWIGSLAGGRGESLVWVLAGSVAREAPLDRIRVAQINGPVDIESWPGVDDRVVLLNGDIVDGFIASIDGAVRVENGSGAVDIPLDRVAGALVANPPSAPTAMLAWLADGSVLEATTIEVAVTGRVSLGLGSHAPEATHEAPTAELLGVLFSPRLITGLSTLEPAEVSFPPERLAGSPPVARPPSELGVGDIDMVGPVSVVWELERPAARLGAIATLPPAMWAWGDCEVIVRDANGAELLRERLRADRPTVEINVPLGGAHRVAIEVASGEGGPVQDRIVLERPMIRWQ